jgi:ribonuclease BN (tRNA processing enzyme)
LTNFRVIGLLIALAVGAASWLLTCVAWRFDTVAAGVRPLTPRSFERMTLVTLGTGGVYEDQNRRGPATAVGLGDRVLLVDAGRGVAESLRAAKVPVSQPDLVLLTSLLPENTLGLDDLLAMGFIDGRREPVTLAGPAGTRALAQAVEAAVRPGIQARTRALGIKAPAPRFVVEEIGDGWQSQRDALHVRAGELPGGPVEALAYRFDWSGRSAAIGFVGWAPDALAALARGVQVLVQEAVFVPTPELAQEVGIEMDPERLRREAALHTSLSQVGDLARHAEAKTLVLVRLRPPPVFDFQITSKVDDHYDGRIEIANDGDEIIP